MVGVDGVVCRKWSGYWGGLEKVVGVVGVNCIRGWGLFGWFGERGVNRKNDLYAFYPNIACQGKAKLPWQPILG